MKLATYFSWTLEERKTLPRNCGKEIPSDTASYSTRKKSFIFLPVSGLDIFLSTSRNYT